MAENVFVVYAPPSAEYPYLAAMILPNGKVEVEPFPTAAEAANYNLKISLILERDGVR
jgi:hypothetical protein